MASTLTLVMICINTVAHTATPWLFGQLLVHHSSLSSQALVGLVGLLVLAWYARVTVNLRSMIFYRVVIRTAHALRMRVVMQLHRAPLQAWKHYNVTDVLSANMRVLGSVRRFMNVVFVTMLPAAVKTLAFLVALWRCFPAAWYFMPGVLLTYTYVFRSTRVLLHSRRRGCTLTDHAREAVGDSLRTTKRVRFHIQEEKQRLETLLAQEQREWIHNNRRFHTIQITQMGLFSLLVVVLMLQLTFQLRHGHITIPELVVVKTYILAIYSQIHQMTGRVCDLINSVVDLEKVLGLLRIAPVEGKSEISARALERPGPILELQGVGLTHEGHVKALFQDIDIAFYKGDHVAVLGPSGAGKSTLCHLMTGLRQPTVGRVQLYGTDLQSLSAEAVGRHVHFIDQEASLITESIKDSLHTAFDQRAHKSLGYLQERMQAHPADATGHLSTGEQRRILIAQCLSYRPEILILDETLSALDRESAAEVLEEIFRQVPTVVLITHQLSLARLFPRLYRLQQGKLEPASLPHA